MKTLLLSVIACCAVILPVTQAHAGGPASKTFGGFSPNDRFKLTVDDKPVAVVISVGSGGGLLSKIPTGFPKLKKSDKVSFKIGSKGELIIDNFSIPFDSGTPTENLYTEVPSAKKPNISQAALIKTAGKPTFMNLVLRKVTGSGLSTKVYQVSYLLEK